MTGGQQRFQIHWQDLDIEVLYCPNWFAAFEEVYGHPLARLEIRQPERKPLPFTETGYRSHFTTPEDIEAAGGPVEYVRAWLDTVAQSPEWKARQEAARQYALL